MTKLEVTKLEVTKSQVASQRELTARGEPPASPDAALPIEVLLVDDREENLTALEAVLASPGYRLVKARSGDQALRYLLDHLPALILMDVQMSGLDGFETAAIIKGGQRTREIPIIFITAISENERFLHKGYEYGAVDYIYKPFDAGILRSKVSVFAELHRKTERLLQAERLFREGERRERERKITELELKSLRREQIEQKRYLELVDGINHGIVWSAALKTLNLTFVSESAERITGFAPAEWLAAPEFFVEHVPPEDREAFQEALRLADEPSAETEVQHRFITSESGVLWLKTNVRLSRDPRTSQPELHGLSVDITQMKEAEQTLQDAKRRSDLLAEASLLLSESLDWRETVRRMADFAAGNLADFCMVDLTDETGDLQNIACAAAPGLALPEVGRFARYPVAPPLRPQSRRAALLRGLDGESLAQIASGEERFRALQGLGLASAIRMNLHIQGKLAGTLTLGSRDGGKALCERDVYLVEDLGYRIASAVENARLYQETEAAVRLRDEFLAVASHELRTPLTPLKLHSQQLMRSLQGTKQPELDTDRMLRLVRATNRQVDRLSRLIDSLLDVTRIGHGKLQLNPSEFDLGDLIREIADRFASDLEAARCDLRLDIEASLRVRWDSFRIEQVMENLLSNAIKYAPGKPVEVRAGRDGGTIEISVRDYGMGIAPADQARIFKRFERAISSDHFGGLGLGLYITSQILEAHKGEIKVASSLGDGTTFVLRLPERLDAATEPRPGSEAHLGDQAKR